MIVPSSSIYFFASEQITQTSSYLFAPGDGQRTTTAGRGCRTTQGRSRSTLVKHRPEMFSASKSKRAKNLSEALNISGKREICVFLLMVTDGFLAKRKTHTHRFSYGFWVNYNDLITTPLRPHHIGDG